MGFRSDRGGKGSGKACGTGNGLQLLSESTLHRADGMDVRPAAWLCGVRGPSGISIRG